MDIKAHLDLGHSKELTLVLVHYVGDSQERFDEFMPYFLHEEWRTCQRAAWALGMICEKHPELLDKWFGQVLEALKNPKHDAVVRNVIRTLEYMDDYAEEYEGQIYDLCFKYLYDPKYPIAFKAFSMTVCRKIAMKYPELKEELISVIADVMENASSGILSRGRRELKILRK